MPILRGQPAPRRAPGFTLVELLIVITLLVTLTAVLAPILLPSPTRALRATAAEVATTLRETRRQARLVQSRQRFLVDTEARTYAIAGAGVARRLPEGVSVALTTGESLLSGDSRGGIDFFPDGTSTGGRVTLALEGRSLRIDIEWLTGRIRVAENTP